MRKYDNLIGDLPRHLPDEPTGWLAMHDGEQQ